MPAASAATGWSGTARGDAPWAAESVLRAFVGVALVATIGAAAVGVQPAYVMAAFTAPLVLVAFRRVLLSWQTLLGLVLAVILFIPIRRYTVFGGGGPVELEPYRILLAVVLGCWALALAADPRVRLHPTGYTGPIVVVWLAILGSLAANLSDVNAVDAVVAKQVSLFAGYFLVMVFVTSVVRHDADLDRILKLLVVGTTVLACCALYEWRAGVNLFNGLSRVLPFLQYQDLGDHLVRGTGVRALASAQHPIALGAALVMVLPLSAYLFWRTGRSAWLACGGVITLGALATGSRTAVLMLMVVAGCLLWLRRGDALRMLPYVVALLLVAQVAMPGTLGTFKSLLNPAYVVQEQSREMGTGSGRIADLDPSLEEYAAGNVFFGQGFGTRIPASDSGAPGVQILDNQWLGTLLELGALGVAGLMWLFGRAVRRMSVAARARPGADGWLPAALAASTAAFAVGLFTFDGFAFVQATFLGFVMLAFGAIAAGAPPRPHDDPAGARSAQSRPHRAGGAS